MTGDWGDMMGYVFTNAGRHRLTVNYGRLMDSYEFDVIGLELISMIVESPPTQLSYAIGDEFNTDGLVLIGTYNTGKIEEVTHYEISGFDSSTATDCCPVQITCDNCSVTVEVEVLPTLYLYETNDDTSTPIYYFGSDTCIKIPETIDGLAVDTIGASCFNANRAITSVIIPDGVTSID